LERRSRFDLRRNRGRLERRGMDRRASGGGRPNLEVHMAWKISGTYLAGCTCHLLCPCPVDGPPTSDDGQCHGVGVFQIADGNLDDTDLSGVNLGLVNLFPSNLTSGTGSSG
jgi:hypothetical protein